MYYGLGESCSNDPILSKNAGLNTTNGEENVSNSKNFVVLRPAFVWNCPRCDRQHFLEAIPAELNFEERQELIEEHGVDPSSLTSFLTSSEHVECVNCGSDFLVHATREDFCS